VAILANNLQNLTNQWLNRNVGQPLNSGFNRYVERPLNKVGGNLGTNFRDALTFLPELGIGADVRDIKRGGQNIMQDPVGGMTDITLGTVGMVPGVGDLAKGLAMSGMGMMKKVGDANPWYHGTNKDFDKFKTDTTYITDDLDLAKIYAREGSDTNAKILNVQHSVDDARIFDTTNPEHRKIFDEQFYRKMGGGGPLSDKGYPDWTDAEDFKEFFEDNDLPFDAVRIQEPQGNISLAITDNTKLVNKGVR
jgi:hypothetical protein